MRVIYLPPVKRFSFCRWTGNRGRNEIGNMPHNFLFICLTRVIVTVLLVVLQSCDYRLLSIHPDDKLGQMLKTDEVDNQLNTERS
jgi:hypothetical protein